MMGGIQQFGHNREIERFRRPWLVTNRSQATSGRRCTDPHLDQPRIGRG
jgi:hypothetical protein